MGKYRGQAPDLQGGPTMFKYYVQNRLRGPIKYCLEFKLYEPNWISVCEPNIYEPNICIKKSIFLKINYVKFPIVSQSAQSHWAEMDDVVHKKPGPILACDHYFQNYWLKKYKSSGASL